MTEDDLIAHYPRLWHMAHQGAWPAIYERGLMSVSVLLDDYAVEKEEKTRLFRTHRPECFPLSHPERKGAVIRDQKPMADSALEKCLQDGLTPTDWYCLLNSYSFFWLSRERIWRLLKARAYRDQPQTVLTLDSAGLVAAYRDKIRLSPINSGSTLFKPQPRGHATFKSIQDFPFHDRASTRRPENNVVELLVEHSVPNVSDYVLAVHEVMNDQIVSEIWRSPHAGNDDKP